MLTSIFGVFTQVITWISTSFTSIQDLFYTTETGLTLLGTLAVAGLAFSVFFLLMGVVQNFLHFRG